MGKALHSLLVVLFVLFGPLCYSQTTVQVSDPRLEIKGNTLHISYDILNSDPEDKYIIDVEIRDEDGHIIEANALNGDFGTTVTGGSNKHITWDLGADSVFIDARIFVTVLAETVLTPVPVIIVQKEEDIPQEVTSKTEELNENTTGEKVNSEDPSEFEAKETDKAREEISKSYSRTGIIFQSLAVPGLGLSRMTGNPHWIRGVAGYGCIAGSIALNRLAIASYEDYRYTVPGTEKEGYYDKSVSQDNTSEILAYVAIGIWVSDLIWTIVGTSDLKRDKYSAHMKGVSVTSSFEPNSQVPLIGIIYRF